MIEAEVGPTPTGRRSYPVAYRIEFLRRWDECLERGTKGSADAGEQPRPVPRSRRELDARNRGANSLHQWPRKQDRYLLHLAIDVFSRYPVAWRIESAETTQMAVLMFTAAFEKYGVSLVLHADNGASIRSTGLLDARESAAGLGTRGRGSVTTTRSPNRRSRHSSTT